MKTLYLDCGMGAAGDMLTACLLELLPDAASFLQELNTLGIPGVHYGMKTVEKCGIKGTQVSVLVNGREEGAEEHSAHTHHAEEEHDDHHHYHHAHHRGQEHRHRHHHHSSLADICEIVANLPVTEKVQEDVLAVYRLIAEAEGHVHGRPVEQIHFHEVGTMDAVADVTAVCLLMERLKPEQVIASPVHVGSGQVTCAHGILPVPAPATAYILRNAPIYGGSIQGELCTPTGAALLQHFVTAFGDMPVMRTHAIGYGMGKKDFPAANCIRGMLGETADAGKAKGGVVELRCNLDDMTGEEIGFAMEALLQAGALDVWVTPIQMKKSRPGTLLTVLCDESGKENLVREIFCHTTTLGVRELDCVRYTLDRHEEVLQTPYGPIRKKIATGYGVCREKCEYEDLAAIAREQGCSLAEVRALLSK